MNVQNKGGDDPATLTRIGSPYLIEQLRFHGVGIPIPQECLGELLTSAVTATRLTRRKGEACESCLHRQLDARARFIALWISSDERFEGTAWRELVLIALKICSTAFRTVLATPTRVAQVT